MRIRIDDLEDPVIAEFLEEHISDMKAVSPPESKHALDLEGLRKPDITFWSVWQDAELVGCGALKEIDKTHGEIKSMRTSVARRGLGIGAKLLKHILSEAESRGYVRVSLETGSMPFFEPGRRLYSKFGFELCPPFAGYKSDPNSVFMTMVLKNG
jgi:putative acetyltransferase